MRRLFLNLFLFIFITAPVYADITTNLQGWWKFDEGTGTSTTADSSGNGYTGTLQASPPWIAGKIGPFALSFDAASSQYVDMGNQTNLNFTTGSFSYSAWFKGSAINCLIINKRAIVGSSGYDFLSGLSSVAGSMTCRIHDGVNPAQSTTWTGTSDGNWHQVVCVVDRSAQQIILYGDGVAIGAAVSIASVGSVSSTASYQIAARSGTPTFYTGSVDDARVYSRALTASDAAELYAYTASHFGIITNGSLITNGSAIN